jgi:hypothetical protein
VQYFIKTSAQIKSQGSEYVRSPAGRTGNEDEDCDGMGIEAKLECRLPPASHLDISHAEKVCNINQLALL